MRFAEVPMRYLARVTIFVALLAGMHAFARSAPPAQDPKETGTITGRVLLDGKPAQSVIVLATPSITDSARVGEQMLKPPAPLKAATDSDGRYRFETLPAGKYNIMPSAPTLVSVEPDAFAKKLSVAEGAAIEGIDFSLSRGCVITGKITDSDGRPVIGEEISLKLVGSTKPADPYAKPEGRMYYTDDRGIYRIYALTPGRYIVSAGSSRDPSSFLVKRPKRVQTYYPGVTDEARSKPVEVIAGAEASGVDIKLGVPDKGFSVSGRVLIAETGAPLANAWVSYTTRPRDGSLEQSNRDEDSFSVPGGTTTTNAKGEFRLDSVEPGNYKLKAGSMTGSGEFHADPVNFEVQSGNIDKLVIKVYLGASISGVVGFDSADADAFDTSTQLRLTAVPDAMGVYVRSGQVAADGSFRIGGFRAGKIRIAIWSPREFSVVGIERNGVKQFDGIDIQPNEQITGLRVVVVRANCVLRGRVAIQGGTLSPDSEVSVRARPLNPVNDSHQAVDVDANGNFVIEGLAPGDYEVEASVSLQGPGTGRKVSAKQQVTLMPGTPAQTSLILDLGAKGSDK